MADSRTKNFFQQMEAENAKALSAANTAADEVTDIAKHLTVKGDQNEKVDGTISVEAAMDMQQKVGMKYALDAGKNTLSSFSICLG